VLFRSGVIDELAEKIKQAPQQAQQPDPVQQLEAQKVQSEIENTQADTGKKVAETQKIMTEANAPTPLRGVA